MEDRKKEQQRSKPSRSYTKEERAWGAGLIPPQLWVGQEVGEGVNAHVPSRLSPSPPLLPSSPPPQQSQRNDQWLTPPCWKGKGGGVGGGGEGVTWTTAASQLIERPLGG